MAYALSDVTHLRDVYHHISPRCSPPKGRTEWVAEEMEVLTSRDTYDVKPEQVWERLKMRVKKPIELLILRTEPPPGVNARPARATCPARAS